jgi:predicted type IV restriction endonuclease
LKDLERIRPLVLLAYEDEMKRSEASGAEDDDAAAGADIRH